MLDPNEQISIHMREIEPLLGSIELIDIREPFEYATGSIETAKNIPMGELLEFPETYLEPDTTYYIVCQSGRRSLNTVLRLKMQGYNVIDVAGGVSTYKAMKM